MLHLSDLSAHATDGERSFRLHVGDIAVAAGEVLAITGESGSGKTMLMELVGLLRRPDRIGRMTLDLHGAPMLDLSGSWAAAPGRRAAIRARHMGIVLQDGGLIGWLTVREHLDTVQRATDTRDIKWCATLLRLLRLEPVADLRPAALSIGQRQRAALARALAHRPALVLIDEPTAPLDTALADQVVDLIVTLARDAGCCVLMTTHDRALIARHALPAIDVVHDVTNSLSHVTRNAEVGS